MFGRRAGVLVGGDGRTMEARRDAMEGPGPSRDLVRNAHRRRLLIRRTTRGYAALLSSVVSRPVVHSSLQYELSPNALTYSHRVQRAAPCPLIIPGRITLPRLAIVVDSDAQAAI